MDGWCHQRSAHEAESRVGMRNLGEMRHAKHRSAERMRAASRMRRVAARRADAGRFLEHGAIGDGATGVGTKIGESAVLSTRELNIHAPNLGACITRNEHVRLTI